MAIIGRSLCICIINTISQLSVKMQILNEIIPDDFAGSKQRDWH